MTTTATGTSGTPAPLVFVDTETTGVHPGRKAWEIAMIRRDESGERAIQMFVEVELEEADPFGLSVGRFYERHPFGRYLADPEDNDEPDTIFGPDALLDIAPPKQPYVSSLTAARLVAQWTHGAHLVGAVPSFDAETLDKLLRWHQVVPAWHYHLVDVEAMAVGYLNARRRARSLPALVPPWKSTELTEELGVRLSSPDEVHTAMGDARWAQRMYDAMTGGDL